MLKIKNRLKNKSDFEKVYKKGNFFSGKKIGLKVLKNNKKLVRIGFVVGKNFSKKAVERNKAKRVLRSASVELIDNIVPGLDIIIILNKTSKLKDLNKKDISVEIKSMLTKSNIIK